MFTPIKPKSKGILNDTILNTPQPQATSTVQRKSILESRYSGEKPTKKKHNLTAQCDSELTQKEDKSSLGLLDMNMSALTNMSTEDEQMLGCYATNAELEFARKLLKKCSDSSNSIAIDINKENNVNVQNITGILPVSNDSLPNEVYISNKDQECNINCQTSTINVTFEPTEISARSSGIDKWTEQLYSGRSFDDINFNINAAEIMQQFNNEKFLSGSQMAEQLSIDEANWHENHTFSMPVTNMEKQKLDFDCFSGIMGDLDLSIASQPGQKISVGQYFKRKCDKEILGKDVKLRNFDLTMETSIEKNNLKSPASSKNEQEDDNKIMDKKYTYALNETTGLESFNILSLSTIANALKDATSGTPRRLVDHLLMAQKKKKHLIAEDNAKEGTCILEKQTTLTMPGTSSNKLDDIISLVNLTSSKLSLDKIKNIKTQKLEKTSLLLSSTMKETEFSTNVCKEEILKKETNDKTAASLFNQDAAQVSTPEHKLRLSNSLLSLSTNDESNIPLPVPSEIDIKSYDGESYDANLQDIKRKESIKKDISDNTTDSIAKNRETEIQFDLKNDVVISKNTEQFCNCIVGVMSAANIELINQGDKWLRCFLELNEIQGDKQSIVLNIPQDVSLIKPNGIHSTKVEVKIIKMCKPIIAILGIIISDMVAKSKWFMKHIICFIPEEFELDVICDSHKQELDFQFVSENSIKVLPVMLHNKNNIDMPVNLSISHDESRMFKIDSIIFDSIRNEFSNESIHIVLKPKEKITVNIRCERIQSTTDCSQMRSQRLKNKLIVHVQYNDGNVLFMKEVPLYVQLGICKIQVIDTDIPITVPKQQGKLLNIINSGNVATHVFASVVPVEDYSNSVTQNFSVKPDDLFLQPGERGSYLITYKTQIPDAKITDDERHAKIKLTAGNNTYYYIVATEQKSLEPENYLRCDTPCNMVSTTSPTSPQSVTSSRSSASDRNSPCSIISSVAVVGNTIPIKSTHAALVWNSVKTGKNEVKDFAIRNTSNNKIKIQIDICDDSKSFKFVGDRHTTNTSMVLALQGTESKTLAIMFSPYHVGPIVGKITIKHYTPARESSESQLQKKIPLYGYGGCSKVKVLETFKDSNGKMWLSLGILSSEITVLKTNFGLQNIGDVCSFAKIKIIPKVISPALESSWYINSKELILNPKEARKISIEFYPKKEDFAILQHSDVSHIATINITYGDEPTRWRIRRLYNKIKETGELAGNENEAFKSIVRPICKTFAGEELNPSLTSIRDTVQNLNDLCTGIHQYEIILTVEACADETFPILHDESQMYHSLTSDNSQIDEVGGASFFASQTMGGYGTCRDEFRDDDFNVTPSTVILNPPMNNEATVTILSFFKVAQPFQTYLSDTEYLSVVPAEGMLPSKKNFPLKIQCSQRIERNIQAILGIYTENNKQDVLIKVNVKRR